MPSAGAAAPRRSTASARRRARRRRSSCRGAPLRARARRPSACRPCRSPSPNSRARAPAKSSTISRAVVRECMSALASFSNWRVRNQPCVSASSTAFLTMPMPRSAAGVRTTLAPRKRISLRRSTLNGLGHRDDQRIALLRADHREADARCCRSSPRSPSGRASSSPLFSASSMTPSASRSLTEPKRVERLDLDVEIDPGRRELVDPNDRRVADRFENALIAVSHSSPLSGSLSGGHRHLGRDGARRKARGWNDAGIGGLHEHPQPLPSTRCPWVDAASRHSVLRHPVMAHIEGSRQAPWETAIVRPARDPPRWLRGLTWRETAFMGALAALAGGLAIAFGRRGPVARQPRALPGFAPADRTLAAASPAVLGMTPQRRLYAGRDLARAVYDRGSARDGASPAAALRARISRRRRRGRGDARP